MSLITERTVEVIKKLVKPHYILEKIARDIVAGFPLSLRYRLYGRTFCYWAAFLKESEHWDRERLETFQFEQLKALLIHAGRNVPYYEQIFSDCGFNPEKV